jgi:complement component 1 Q subcomponent-binding protein, mitochondrial
LWDAKLQIIKSNDLYSCVDSTVQFGKNTPLTSSSPFTEQNNTTSAFQYPVKSMFRFVPKGVSLAKSLQRQFTNGVVRKTLSSPIKFNGVKHVAQPMSVRFASTLKDIARQELDHELGNKEVDQEYEDAKKLVLKEFKLVEQPGKGTVRLTRKHGDETIEVVFDVQDVEDEFDYNEDNATETEEKAPNVGVNFDIFIRKPNAQTMVISAVGGEEFIIRNVRFIPTKVESNLSEEKEYYAGPQFDELEEELQEAIFDHLEARKLNADIAYFVLAHSREKEQKEYETWLENLETFADK